jgi:threonine synthase
VKRHRAGVDLRGKIAVCILTGHGLKDPDTAMTVEASIHQSSSRIEDVERVLGWS